MQNTTFLALSRPIFALKKKIAPLALEMRTGVGPDVILTRKLGFILAEELFFFFRRSPVFGQKNRLNLSKDLFFFLFGYYLNLDRKTD